MTVQYRLREIAWLPSAFVCRSRIQQEVGHSTHQRSQSQKTRHAGTRCRRRRGVFTCSCCAGACKVLHTSHCIIEPLEKLWQSLILARPAHCPGSLLGKESVRLHTPTLLLPLHPLHQVTGGSEEAMQFWGHTQSGCHHTLLTHRRPSHYTLSRLHDPSPRRRVR